MRGPWIGLFVSAVLAIGIVAYWTFGIPSAPDTASRRGDVIEGGSLESGSEEDVVLQPLDADPSRSIDVPITPRSRNSEIAEARQANEERDIFDYDEDEEPDRARVREAVLAALEEYFVDYRLSSDEVDRVTDSLITLRTTQNALRELPFGPETAEERRLLVERIGLATSSFNEVLDIDPADFTAEAAVGGVGIDDYEPGEIVPEADFIGGPE